MSEENKKSLIPYIVVGLLVVIVITTYFWPSKLAEAPLPVVVEPEVSIVVEPEPEVVEPMPEIETFEPEIVPTPEPLDTSDGTVKTKLLGLSDYDAFARLLINEALLQRFVIMTNSLADDQLAANHQVLSPPEQAFRTYRQADKEWIDPASYKRYTPYVDVLDSIKADSLLDLYAEYKPAIDNIFAEISDPDANFDDKLMQTIDVLLDTPAVPEPIEVYTESVMYRYKDSRLESLTAPQKQLLRTGPENMRRIKAKLREIKQALSQ
ncbi:MAG: hypothetical protein ACI8Z9_002033 [Paraglaciecola sp.]|jgi:hypothetical protein